MSVIAALFMLGVIHSASAQVQKKYDAGVTDTEIKIGNIMPYSGPASAYGLIGKAEAAYFKRLNDRGGINGRKINFISYDDAYSPPKAVEQARKLVESDEVLLIFSSMGTPSNSAIHKYINGRKVPQLFVASAATKWADPKNFPWTMGLAVNYQTEGRIFAKSILEQKPDAKIAILFQNDDFGKDLMRGFIDALGSKQSMIVARESYEVSEPTIDSQVVKLKHSDADVLVNFSSPKFAAQAIKKVSELGWRPLHIVTSVSSSVGAVIAAAGLDSLQGLISATFYKDTMDPQWKDDPGMASYLEFLNRYMPEANRADTIVTLGYLFAQAMEQVLKQCGNELTRENIMKQAASLRAVKSDVLLPGITINTSADNFSPIEQMQMMRFKGTQWELFGGLLKGNMQF
ncbi:ABC transporter substrate-binding protein [Bradyrhizobium sp. AZCC 1678]|uniref:ABC transporter substrate-binding protein n=1 Tax=Bradyrhizobium sp. AZCC 1678 TaxID=3117030 RepID=UPI002FEF28FC